MKTKPSLKNVLLLTLFMSVIGVNAFWMTGEALFYPKYAISGDYIHLTILFWARALAALFLGLVVLPFITSRKRDKSYLSYVDRVIICCFFYFTLPLLIDYSILNRLDSGSSYLQGIFRYLYDLPSFIIGSLILLPFFVFMKDYKPWRAFSGGLILGCLVLAGDRLFIAMVLGQSFSDQYAIFFNAPFDWDFLYGFDWEFHGKYLLIIPLCATSSWVAHLYFWRKSQSVIDKNIAVFE